MTFSCNVSLRFLPFDLSRIISTPDLSALLSRPYHALIASKRCKLFIQGFPLATSSLLLVLGCFFLWGVWTFLWLAGMVLLPSLPISHIPLSPPAPESKTKKRGLLSTRRDIILGRLEELSLVKRVTLSDTPTFPKTPPRLGPLMPHRASYLLLRLKVIPTFLCVTDSHNPLLSTTSMWYLFGYFSTYVKRDNTLKLFGLVAVAHSNRYPSDLFPISLCSYS